MSSPHYGNQSCLRGCWLRTTWRVVNVPSAFDYNIATWDLLKLKIPDWNLYRALTTTAADKRLKDVKGLTLVDGSIVEALPRIAMASFRPLRRAAATE